ncbi:HNH endonuclease [Streptomyces albireticuli]|uniref:HNH endonuclease n=1 Tax=Streptomyces albireticuli TaxID=1940 RepID=A0A2A2D170_9ACTN|nr:HNH endonuclease signature motif containing protein [Streptomyces albireticuli]MCD9196063.1 HNH endonuclease [Streptomyces albireticuli]PAU46183.1 HNH endonuclease [Streptomyces albireticuli]
MPTSPPTRCSEGGCHELTTTGRCERHTRKAWANKSKAWGAGSTRKWRTRRAQQLADEPHCRRCGTKATQVDHIVPLSEGGSQWDQANLQSLCADCHELKSAEDRRRRTRDRYLTT